MNTIKLLVASAAAFVCLSPLISVAETSVAKETTLEAPQRISELIFSLAKPSRSEQAAAARELESMREAALPELIAACGNPNETVRIWAITILGNIGDARTRMTIQDALHDESSDVRLRAAIALSKLPTTTEFTEKEPTVTKTGLKKATPSANAQPARARLKEVPAVKKQLKQELPAASVAKQRIITEPQQVAEETPPQIEEKSESEDPIAELVAMLKHPEREERQRATRGLEALGEKAIPALLAATKAPDERTRVWSVTALGNIAAAPEVFSKPQHLFLIRKRLQATSKDDTSKTAKIRAIAALKRIAAARKAQMEAE